MKLTVGFSPCPNDTFIFDALLHQKIDTEGLTFEPIMEDVEALNRRAFAAELDVTKLSYHVFAYVVKDYALLEAGSALGNGVGPLVVTRGIATNHPEGVALVKAPPSPPEGGELPSKTTKVNALALKGNDGQNSPPSGGLGGAILSGETTTQVALPGKYTTANLLFSLAYPEVKNKKMMLFSDIENAVLTGEVTAGVIIHENRFTYAERGLVKIIDLGEFWEQMTHTPIPLGGICVRRHLTDDVQQKVERVMARSVQFAFDNPESSRAFVKAHAQEMSETVMQQHIALYVNDFTRGLGEVGRSAVKQLFERAWQHQIIPKTDVNLFLN